MNILNTDSLADMGIENKTTIVYINTEHSDNFPKSVHLKTAKLFSHIIVVA